MRIGILQAGHLPEAMRPTYGDYDAPYRRFLDGFGLTFETWRVVDGAFPATADAADGWLITGSRHGAYEQHAWIPPLETLIRSASDRSIPLVGICFGHQIVAQALGGRVEKSSRGWGVGRMDYEWSGHGTVTLNAWHQDQVTQVPASARVLAQSAFCPAAALTYGDTILTIQAHPEFDRAYVEQLIAYRGGAVPKDRIDAAQRALDGPVDNAMIARDIVSLFRRETVPS